MIGAAHHLTGREGAVSKPKVLVWGWPRADDVGGVRLLPAALCERIELVARLDSTRDEALSIAGLRDLAEAADAALVIVPGGEAQAARDRALVGCGVLVALLGSDRVALLHPEGEALPSGPLGTRSFRYGEDAGSGPPLDLLDHLGRLRPRVDGFGASGDHLGFSSALQESTRGLTRITKALAKYARDGASALDRPFVFDSSDACLSTYVEALGLVGSRFWTTTLLGSGFWTRRIPRVIDANARLMQRLQASGGDARRLFLLEQPLERVAEAYRDRRTLLDRMDRGAEVARLDAELENLRANIAALAADRCTMRVVFDADRLHRELPEAMGWRAAESELAIYDRFRVDVFDAGAGGIARVTSFTRASGGFDEYLQAAETFFERLWRRAEGITAFRDELQRAVESSRSKIHYRANWLARYEFALDAEDESLKRAEARQIENVIARRGLHGRLRSYLDVGTCTGRCVLLLRNAVRDDGRIVAVDDDAECIQFARSNLLKAAPEDRRITLVHGDFGARELSIPGAPFQLVTCMMGTLSHFGRDRNGRREDALQAVLRRLAGLLDEEGLLVFSTWSPRACESEQLLSIYDRQDCRRLAAWTPREAELEERLAAAGFTSCERSQPDWRLNLWVCSAGARGRGAI